MSQLIVVLYPVEYQAMQVMAALQDIHNGSLTALRNVALLCKDDEGRCHLSPHMIDAYDETWKSLLELFLLALSTGLHTLATQWSDFGIDEQFIQRMQATFGRKCSALFILMPFMTGDKVLPVLSRFGGIVLQTTLAEPLAAAM